MPAINNLTRAVDVAAFIINRQGEMPSIKLQSLVYYSQAWSLVWEEPRYSPNESKHGQQDQSFPSCTPNTGTSL